MTNTKNTKRALLSSVMALFLCFAMLIGTTYAWFTDSVTSAGNKIVAGTLDVDLFLWNSATDSVEITESSAPIFGANSLVAQNNAADTIWEPGKTQVVYLSIKNNGTLDLKYKVALEVTDVEKNIIDVLYYTITPDATWSQTPVAWDATNAKQVVVGTNVDTEDVKLEASKEHFFALSIHMDENAGNDYQGASVTFDIKVLATQVDSESDSFDNQYDANLDAMTNGVSRTLDDGSTAFYYGEDSGFYGRVRLTDLPENIGSEYVVPTEVNDLGGALVGVKLDKLTIPASVAYANKSLQSATIDEVVIEDGATAIPNRMFYQAKVNSVVIPDSVTVVEQYAFSQAYPQSLVIPASVTTLEEGCFAYMPNLETVVFEGDVTLPKYAFRACPKLATVEIKGDVTVATTSMIFSNYESGGKDDMTFYVSSQENAEKLISCLGAYNDTNTGSNRNKWTVYINETLFVNVKNATELQNALNNATQDTIINITADITGDVAFTQKKNISLVVNGNDKTMTNGSFEITARAGKDNPATLTIKNINFTTTDTERTFIHSEETNYYPNNITISNCTFEGTGAGSDVVAVKVKSANNLVIEKCKANNVHSLLQNTSGWNLTVKKCEVTNAGRGMSLGTVQGALIEDVKIDASTEKYGIRIDAAYSVTATIKNWEISAFCPVVVRKASVDYNLVFEGENTMTAANTDGIWCAIGTSEYETNGSLPTAATGDVTVTLTDAALDANGIYGAAN